MPQGNVVDEKGKVIWDFDICCEFDCDIEYAEKRNCDCKGDFTRKPCLFYFEHQKLNLKEKEDDQF